MAHVRSVNAKLGWLIVKRLHACFICGLCLPLQADCNNYIRLLQFLDERHIYVCGTYAFDPQCAFLVCVTHKKKCCKV